VETTLAMVEAVAVAVPESKLV